MANTNDTIAATHDSVTVTPFTPVYPEGIPRQQTTDTAVQSLAVLPVMEAPKPAPAAQHARGPLYDTGSMSLLLISLFFIVASFKSGYKYIENLGSGIFSVRKRREDAFATHTMGDMRMMMALVFNTCLLQGIILFYAIGHFVPHLRATMQEHVFMNVGALTAACLAYHFCQHALYATLGYVFSDPISRRLWTAGFKATQAVTGMLLFPVTAFLLLFPSAMDVLLVIAALVYILAKIVFILKGLRIFFNKVSQSFYFILYLCSVEFVPPVMLGFLLVELCTLLQSIKI